ncbi:hypothetical protein DSO57_1005605 [Entomophthora muscae]|uniref:Uncharacterized protein n=1 Tax=Entomophthora muscae TaxID=34485 RepID=A0ACC2RMK3_9FUNG|nr:hypothetical protein DSO57_1005605 [Entomophthora muscae]
MRDHDKEISMQDSENRKIEEELFLRLSSLKEEVRSKRIEEAFLSRTTTELLSKKKKLEAQCEKGAGSILKSTREVSILKAQCELCEDKYTANLIKSESLGLTLEQLNQALEQLDETLKTLREEHSKLSELVKGQADGSKLRDSLHLDIEALKNDNSTLEIEIHKHGLSVAPISANSSLSGSSPYFNLKAELEKSTPELLNVPLDTPIGTHRKKSSVTEAPRKKYNPKPKPKPNPYISDPEDDGFAALKENISQSNIGSLRVILTDLVEAELKRVLEKIQVEKEAWSAAVNKKIQRSVSNPKDASTQTNSYSFSKHVDIQTRLSLTSPLKMELCQVDYANLVWGYCKHCFFISSSFLTILRLLHVLILDY